MLSPLLFTSCHCSTVLRERQNNDSHLHSPSFRGVKVREKSLKATRLIRLALLKQEQKVFLLHFPLTSMLLCTQETWQPQWPHVTYLIRQWGRLPLVDGDIQYGGFLSCRSPWQIKGGCWYLSPVSLILNGYTLDKRRAAKTLMKTGEELTSALSG